MRAWEQKDEIRAEDAAMKLSPGEVEIRLEPKCLKEFEEELRWLKECRNDIWKKIYLEVALYGVSKAGKTSFLLGLYLHRDDDQFGMRIRFDQESAVYLSKVADHFESHGQVEPTEAGLPKFISFVVTTKEGLKIHVETRDLSGSFAKPRSKGESWDVVNSPFNRFRVFINGCRAILCFADWRESEYSFQDAIDLLPEHSTVVLVVNKLDELVEEPGELLKGSRETANAIYESLDLDAIRDLDRYVGSRFPANRYRCVPMAARGPVHHGGKLKASNLRPWNLYVPWQLIIEAKLEDLKAEEQRLDTEIIAMSNKIKAIRRRTEQDKLRRIEEQEKEMMDRAEQAAARARERSQREYSFSSRLEELENQIEGASWENVCCLLMWYVRIRRIRVEAEKAGFPHLAQHASDIRRAIQALVGVGIVFCLGSMILWMILFFR